MLDEGGRPIEGAKATVTYSPVRGSKYETGRGFTDEEGLYQFTAIAQHEVFVSVEKQGYYKSRTKDVVYSYNDEQWVAKSPGPEVELILKKMIDPKSMFAFKRFIIDVPEFNQPLGYDLMLMDWLPPFGSGEEVDVIFEVNGFFNSDSDRESNLVVRFPNIDDGLISFEGDYFSGSELISPQVAPETGYVAEYTHRKAVFYSGEKDPGGSTIVKSIGGDKKPSNYILRIRTRRDDDGVIREAYYGKLYGAFAFDGVWERSSAIVLGDYYLNPTSNDRSLEYKVGSNLFVEIEPKDDPSRP